MNPDESAIDVYTVAHLGFGFAAGMFTSISPLQAFAASAAFEIVENTTGVKFGLVKRESDINIASDIVAFMVAYVVGRRLRPSEK
jgi:hypothetical protein